MIFLLAQNKICRLNHTAQTCYNPIEVKAQAGTFKATKHSFVNTEKKKLRKAKKIRTLMIGI